MFLVDPGAASDAHRLNHEEVFIPLHGTLSVVLDGKEMEVATGDACSVPAQCLLQVANRSHEAVRALVCVPAGIKATFADGREVGTPPWAQ